MVGGSVVDKRGAGGVAQNALDYGPPSPSVIAGFAPHTTPNSTPHPPTTSADHLSYVSNGALSETLYSSLRSIYERMTNYTNSCQANCSGRGECLNGTCFCLVQYEGDTCRDPNLAYFVSFATVFYLIAVVSLAQLVVCIRAEYMKQKTPSLRRACRVTTQKMLYIITFVAATLRGAYFSSPLNADLMLAPSFMSAFYPIILSGGSLIVCFWAEIRRPIYAAVMRGNRTPTEQCQQFKEMPRPASSPPGFSPSSGHLATAFHLRDIRCERPRFLSKSFCGFMTFNIVTYSLLIAEILLTRETETHEERSFLTHVFNGCYAVLLFIVVVFFLIYGVEVYFKVRGGFMSDTIIVGSVHSRTPPQDLHLPPLLNSADLDSPSYASSSSSTSPLTPPSTPSSKKSASKSTPTEVKSAGEQEQDPSTQRLVPEQVVGDLTGVAPPHRGIDQSQLHQSRFGLVFQACMLMITVCFLFSDVLGGFWKNRVPLMSRNAYDIIFRVVELGVALWFPCVLWNCMSPEQLWILNPKKILKKLDIDRSLELGQPVPQHREGSTGDVSAECWICYDTERIDAGPLIQPCDCRGDVGAVHHHCLRKWLMECAENYSENLSCKVCGAVYQLEKGRAWWIGQGFTPRHWLQTASLVTVMCGTIAGTWALVQMYEDAYIRSLAAGATLLIIYVCLRFLGFNTFNAYQRARYSAVKILGRHFAQRDNNCASSGSTAPGATANVATISSEISVDMNATGVPKLSEAAI
ncbi:uncharacterized protein [Panulirus ornatus]|uniref:uncharacterized protein isoform X2 n=1 Tax=Panulirus ornatus TaxID=150431 RepID=UPI003A8B0978